jgi:polysaccharide pyruvyl transferase WcaK-like protein
MRQIGETELLVATRFHNVVCGLMMQRPLISISYAKKNDVLMEDMGLGAFCQHIEQLDLERLKAQFTELMAERETYIPHIAKQTAAYREQLEQQGSRLTGALL